ncbi:MAG: c-type cytochrome [Rubrivivax sp.]
MRVWASATLATAALMASMPAAAQFAKPEDAVKYRKAAVAANADLVAVASRLPFAGFVEGTAGTEKGTPKANVWTDKAKFDEGAKKMQEAVAKLQTAAKSNNLDQVKAAFGDAAGTCKACHDNYRN